MEIFGEAVPSNLNSTTYKPGRLRKLARSRRSRSRYGTAITPRSPCVCRPPAWCEQKRVPPAACTSREPDEDIEQAPHLLQDDASAAAAAAKEASSSLGPARRSPAPNRRWWPRLMAPYLSFLEQVETNRERRHQENLQVMQRIAKALENCSPQRSTDE